MPLYEYRCEKCGQTCELLMRNSNDTPEACPKCGAASLTKIMSSFAVGPAVPSSPAPSCGSCASAGSCPYRDE